MTYAVPSYPSVDTLYTIQRRDVHFNQDVRQYACTLIQIITTKQASARCVALTVKHVFPGIA